MSRAPACIGLLVAAGLFLPAPSALGQIGMGAGSTSPRTAVKASPTAATRLYVKTIPAGAEVTVDGERLGTSDGLFLVPAGTRRVSVQFDGQDPEVRQVEVVAGRITRVEIACAADDPAAGIGPAAAAAPAPGGGGASDVAATDDCVVLKSPRAAPVTPDPLSKLDGQFAKPVNLDCRAMSLHDVVTRIGAAGGVKTMIDRQALADAGTDPDRPITFAVAGIALASALDALCEQEGLAWTVRDEAVEVTTLQAAAEHVSPQIFAISDLLTGPAAQVDWFGHVLQNVLPLVTWPEAGKANKTLRVDTTAAESFLLVRQAWRDQRRIAAILARLRQLKATPAGKRTPIAGEGYWSDAAAARAARTALGTVVAAEFDAVPLADVVARLAERAGVPIAVDLRALEDGDCDPATPVTVQLTDQPLGEVLEAVLDDLDLAVSLSHDRLVVTTKQAADRRLTVAVYPVDRWIGNGRSLHMLVDLLETNVTPLKWLALENAAVARPIAGDPTCLVIAHTTAGHREVDAFLQMLP